MAAIDCYPTTPEGGYFHKADLPEEMWLDGLYMEGPLRAQYGAEFHHPEYFNEVIFQALTMQKHTRDPKTGLLLYHAWSYDRKVEWADKETGCSPSSGAELWMGACSPSWTNWISFPPIIRTEQNWKNGSGSVKVSARIPV